MVALPNPQQQHHIQNLASGAAQRVASAGAEAANEAMLAKAMHARSSDLIKESAGGGFSLGGLLGGAWGKASTLLMLAPMLGGAARFLSNRKMLASVAPSLTKVAGTLDLPNMPMNEVGSAAEKLFSPGTAEKIQHGTQRVAEFAQKTLGRSNLGAKALESLKGQTATTTLFGGAQVLLSTVGAVTSLTGRLKVLKQMQKDLTGETPSSFSLMFGGKSLHPLVAEARREAIGGRSALGTALQLGGAVGNAYMMLFDRSTGFKSMAKMAAVGMGTGMAAKAVTAGHTALDSYNAMYQSFAQTGRAQMEIYEGLIGGLSPKAPGELVRQIAERAYMKQLPPDQVLKMVAETSFLKEPSAAVKGKFTADVMARRQAQAGAGRGAAMGAA